MGLASYMRMLRLGRLARIFKMIKIFFQSDLSWTEHETFQTFIVGVIAVNSIIMGFETDIPDFWGWYYIEQILLVIYTFELLVRLKNQGFTFFCNQEYFWNYMDFTIVMGGIVDQWLLPSITIFQTIVTGKQAKPLQLGQGIVLLRMARLLRILRLVRLVKSIPPLFNLMQGVFSSLQGMSWVFVLTVVVLYAFSILAVRLIGDNGLVFGGTAPDQARGIFPSIMDSMFVLFKVMNGDGGSVEPLLETMPGMKIFYALYMIMTCWAILSILTAVVSENMIAVQEALSHEREVAEQEASRKSRLDMLIHVFSEVDVDKDGTIDEMEFSELLANPDRCNQLCEATNMSQWDLVEFFLALSQNNDGQKVCDFETFIQQFDAFNEPTTYRHVMQLQRQVSDLEVGTKDQYSTLLEMHEQLMAKVDKLSDRLGQGDRNGAQSAPSTPALQQSGSSDMPSIPHAGSRSNTPRKSTTSRPVIGGYEVRRSLSRHDVSLKPIDKS